MVNIVKLLRRLDRKKWINQVETDYLLFIDMSTELAR